MANFGHPDIFHGSLMELQQVYVKNMGAADHVNQGVHLYSFKHRSIKWTNVPFYASIAMAAWNSSRLLSNQLNHEVYKNVLINIAHYYGSTTMRPLHTQKVSFKQKHALSTPFQTYAMDEKGGYCVRCLNVDNIKRRINHYCVQCSNATQISWLCIECFEWVHTNPKYVRKPLFLTTKPFSKQTPLYTLNE